MPIRTRTKPRTTLRADGQNFAAALSASAATGTDGTVVALTAGRSLAQATSDLLAADPGAKVCAIGPGCEHPVNRGKADPAQRPGAILPTCGDCLPSVVPAAASRAKR